MPITEEVYQAKYEPSVRLGRLVRRIQDDAVVSHIRSMLHKREKLREEGRYEEADAIRQSLEGVMIMDSINGTKWLWKDYEGQSALLG